MTQTDSILVLDSGLGGLSVLTKLRETLPHAPLLYVADTGAFPYGNRTADALFSRSTQVIAVAGERAPIALVVIACNTLSTLCLEALRRAHPALRFVGTVPAVKVAAATSKTRRFTLLATPNTVRSEYTAALIAQHAAGCRVDLVGARYMAACAESLLLGEAVDKVHLAEDIAACFHSDAYGRTDSIVLGCTHFPFLHEAIHAHAPWEVMLIDPALAIARQTARLWTARAAIPAPPRACVTSAQEVARYARVFVAFGFAGTEYLEV